MFSLRLCDSASWRFIGMQLNYGEATGDGVGEGVGVGFSIAWTSLRGSRVTMPWRRYQIPSFVSHTSSASTVVLLVSLIVNPPAPLFPPVDNGLELNCTGVGAAATAGVGVTLGEGDGDCLLY